MARRILFQAGVVFLLVLPFFASAVTIEEVRLKIEDLQRKISLLQQQINTSSVSYPSASQAGGGFACPNVGVTLKFGSSGNDVERLQRFLALDGNVYPEGLATGYYGSLTERAIQRWQTRFNIVSSGTPETTGFGVMGPRTAAIIAVKCQEVRGSDVSGVTDSQSQVGGFIRVSPISGGVPLSVAVEVVVNVTHSCDAATYVVEYGDATIATIIPVAKGVCGEQKLTLAHIYQNGGTYYVTLSSGLHRTQATVVVSGLSLPPSAPVVQPPPPTYSGISITSDPSGNPLTIEVSFDVGECAEYKLAFEDGAIPLISSPQCASNTVVTKKFTHTYPSPGTYIITLSRGGSGVERVAVVIVSD